MPENERSVVGSVLKRRRDDMLLNLRMLTTSEGGGRLFATLP